LKTLRRLRDFGRDIREVGKVKKDSAVAVLKGAATYVPFLYQMLGQRHMNLESATPEASYRVWMKHLSLLHNMTGCGVPSVVAELGPGDTLGTGVAALFSGAQRYVGIDVLPFARSGPTLEVARGLRDLFSIRARVVVKGWPDFTEYLDNAGFLSSVLTDEILAHALAEERASAILSELSDVVASTERSTCQFINYSAPYSNSSIPDDSIDLFYSHSVLEHVENLPAALSLMHASLKSKGLMSHQFDLRSHNITRSWDGHREFGNNSWKIVVGKRPFLLNRLSYSKVLEEIERAGFRILDARRLFDKPTLDRSQLCREWQSASDEDLRTISGFVQAQKI
jgi:SAM-dependent methyltransferase